MLSHTNYIKFYILLLFQTEDTSNTTTFWSLSYSRQDNFPGRYIMQIDIEYRLFPYIWSDDTSARIEFIISGELSQ